MIGINTKDNEQDSRFVRIEDFMKGQGFAREFDEIYGTAVQYHV